MDQEWGLEAVHASPLLEEVPSKASRTARSIPASSDTRIAFSPLIPRIVGVIVGAGANFYLHGPEAD